MYVEQGASGLPAVGRCREALPDLPWTVVEDQDLVPVEHRNRSTLFLGLPRGKVFGSCPGTHGHICCNYTTIDLYLGCTLGCTYCIMQSYLNFAPVTVYVDPQPGIDAVIAAAQANPGRTLRVGTGEVGDSLLLDPIFRLSEVYINAFAPYPNIVFEMKTKTDTVDHLLGVRDKGNAVVGFSLSAETAAAAEDGQSASIDERLAAARKVADAGYGLAFHFDPIIRFEGWAGEIEALTAKLRSFAHDRIAWISMGTVRYPPELRDHMTVRPFFFDEFVPCRDGKYRYVQRERIKLYRHLNEQLSKVVNAPIYLCMESATVWQAVFQSLPGKGRDGVRAIFAPLEAVRGRRGG